METKKNLDATEVWHIAADAMHVPEYRANYRDALRFMIRDKKFLILDTACGSGFPAMDLYKDGFTKLEASDADKKSAEILQAYFNDLNIPIPVSVGKWQELAEKIDKKFDIVLNCDNSFVYMDGWSEHGDFAVGAEAVFQRVSAVLKNFYKILKSDGFVIVGLGKHYHTGTLEYRLPLEYNEDGTGVSIEWFGTMDWQKRENRWTVKVSGNDFEGEFLKRSYAITKEEITELMKKVGFKKVHIFEPDGIKDNFIIGLKNDEVVF
jgi:SAM-dependent methyltransferase